jgi:hypothetical protein
VKRDYDRVLVDPAKLYVRRTDSRGRTDVRGGENSYFPEKVADTAPRAYFR